VTRRLPGGSSCLTLDLSVTSDHPQSYLRPSQRRNWRTQKRKKPLATWSSEFAILKQQDVSTSVVSVLLCSCVGRSRGLTPRQCPSCPRCELSLGGHALANDVWSPSVKLALLVWLSEKSQRNFEKGKLARTWGLPSPQNAASVTPDVVLFGGGAARGPRQQLHDWVTQDVDIWVADFVGSWYQYDAAQHPAIWDDP